MRIELSPMGLRDLPLFNSVRNECCQWLHDPTQYTLPQAVEWFERRKSSYLVVLLDGVPIGYCRVTAGNADRERVVGLDLHKDYRGRGLAPRVYHELFVRLSNLGVDKFRLFVLKQNVRAKRLYDALGFKVVNETETDFEMFLERI